MDEFAKIGQLQKLIHDQLFALINHDYWLFNVPYHNNVGDVLIWQGETDFLEKISYKCMGTTSYFSPIPHNISSDDIILIHGGGNFGDVWPIPQEYQMEVIRQYPENRILMFPQTVHWQNEENLRNCASALSKHKKLTICARDKQSYDLLKSNFRNDILLVPDMAFYIDTNKWRKPATTKGALLLKRDDRELKEYQQINNLIARGDITICDWLPFTEDSWQKTWFRRTKKYMPSMFDWYARNIFRPYIINSGIELVGSHKKIYSTRLHAAILSILLGKAGDLTWFDNSYGKNSNFYETWLSDVDGITFIK